MYLFVHNYESPEWDITCLVKEWAFAETIDKSDEVSGSKGGKSKFHNVWKS
jgi:hypothetical protein